MNKDKLRSLLAPMTRGTSLVIPHPTKTLTVKFDWMRMFSLDVVNKGEDRPHASSCGYTSLKEFIDSLMYYFQPVVGYVYQHINGNVYTIIAIANESSKRIEYPPTVVYQGKNGLVWAKPLTNFINKMTRIK